MSLVAGTRLGPYELQSLIGQGGMGEVYEARDTRLDRSVAIKVLPPEFSADPDRRARFEREAKTVAGLNHPHICTLHDVGEHPSTGSGPAALYLVMEHLQGQTLADRLAKGPLPLEQALTVATEIADALSTAHRQSVIHRDLKPGNVMLTKTGAKLLDFGLAKLTGHGEQAAAASLASAPTQTKPLTSEGAIVGTLRYMAPEQVEGKPADARSDLWALGAILYEMLTGKRAFSGDSAASLIGNIMNAEPPSVVNMQPLTPSFLDRLVKKCLAKSPDDRPDTAHDVADDLRWIAQCAPTPAVEAASPKQTWRRVGLPASLIIPTVLATGGALLWHYTAPAASRPVRRLTMTLPVDVDLYTGTAPGAALLPDDSGVVFIGVRAGTRQLFLRPLDRFDATALQSTTAYPATSLFASPDSRSVAFAGSGVGLNRVTFSDGLVEAINADVDGRLGGAWGSDGRVTYTRGGELWQIAETGGAAKQLTKRDAERG